MKRVRTGEDVAKARAVMGMTQEQLATALRIQGASRRNTVLRWENGKIALPGPVSVAIEALLTGWRPTNHKESK